MDFGQMRSWLDRRRRRMGTSFRHWVQFWPPQYKMAANRCWLVLRLVGSAILVIVRVIALSASSPWVLFADLFRRRKRVAHHWLVYLAVLALAMAAGNWSLTGLINQRYQRGLATLERYLQYTQDASMVSNTPYSDLINRYALSSRIDPALLAAVVACESSFNPDAVSHAGARGLMQIMPGTWSDLNPQAQCRGDHLPPSEGPGCIFDPEANIGSGSRYLRELLDEFDDNAVTALAAYNAGRGTVNLYASTTGELPPYQETRMYLQNVTRVWSGLRSGSRLGNLWQPEQLELWQTRLSAASILMWGIAAAWVLLKLPAASVVRGRQWKVGGLSG